jgi:hypothetical protein
MKVEVLYIEGCPNHRPAVHLVTSALVERGFQGTVVEVPITSVEQANALAFPGSPTIRINGRDVEPEVEESSEFSFSCRTYAERGKLSGVPSQDLIRRAIHQAQEQSDDK